MQHFVTVLDSNYFSRLLALHHSMERKVSNFYLWVVATDPDLAERMRELQLRSVQIIDFSSVSSTQLESLRRERSVSEFHWTITPQLFDWVFKQDSSVVTLTYVDADVWFLKDPKELLAQFEESDAAVLITEHNYARAFDQSDRSGRFCVQFISAKRAKSKEIISLWKHQCLEWCFNRVEDGKFGDQKYLDDWPALWGREIFIPAALGDFQGPWNALRFEPSEALLFHFHGVQTLGCGLLSAGTYPIPGGHRRLLYRPYLRLLSQLEKDVPRKNDCNLFSSVLISLLQTTKRGIRWLKFGLHLAVRSD